MGDSRTILTEYVSNGKHSPLYGGSYSVVACRLVAYGGFESDEITARTIDNHFLIVNRQVWRRDVKLEEILGIVDIDKPQKAEERMYKEAKKIAERRAKLDKNTVIDITSKANRIPREAEYYAGTNWGGPTDYRTRKRELALRQ